MLEFTLVDLYSQYDEVLKYVDGMVEDEIIDWMRNFGSVTKISNPYDTKLYSFRSNAGIVTGFRFNEDGRVAIFH
jgi:hypothetical protein